MDVPSEDAGLLTGKTHRLQAKPRISVRFLADFMAATERSRRTIIRDCKFPPIARIFQHDEAKNIIGTYLRGGKVDPTILRDRAQDLRGKMASSDFERDALDINADYIERFASVVSSMKLPDADYSIPGRTPPLTLGGTEVRLDLCMRLQRVTRTNKIKIGAASLRYAKGKPLSPEIGSWQSAFLHGYLQQDAAALGAEPEHKLCLTIDAHAGIAHEAPTDSVRRFKNMAAACETIAERWDRIDPPEGAQF